MAPGLGIETPGAEFGCVLLFRDEQSQRPTDLRRTLVGAASERPGASGRDDPTLGSLAANGVLLPNAYSTTPVLHTGAARADDRDLLAHPRRPHLRPGEITDGVPRRPSATPATRHTPSDKLPVQPQRARIGSVRQLSCWARTSSSTDREMRSSSGRGQRPRAASASSAQEEPAPRPNNDRATRLDKIKNLHIEAQVGGVGGAAPRTMSQPLTSVFSRSSRDRLDVAVDSEPFGGPRDASSRASVR